MSNDAEDEILEEIPIYITKNVEDSLFIFQYPTKTTAGSDKKETIVNCFIKPIHRDVKLEVALNTESINYDQFKAEKLAITADGKTREKDERPIFKRGIMDTVTYTSKPSLVDINKFVMCVYQDKEIHASPLTSIMQMRPTLAHFDKEDKRRKEEEKARNEEDEEEEAKTVTVKFSTPGVGKERSKRLRFSLFNQGNDEPWYEAYWHLPDSIQATMERQKMFATTQNYSHVLNQDEMKYIKRLLPSDGVQQGIDALLPARVYSKQRIKTLPLVEQLKIILKDAKILSFDGVMKLLRDICEGDVQKDRVLRTLPQVSILLQGNWVPKSEILYPPDSLSDSNGVCADLMVRARDYVVFKFSRTNYLYRRQVATITQLPPDEALEVLKTVAFRNKGKKWELRLPKNATFEARHSELVQRQDMIWRAMEHIFNDMECDKPVKRVRNRSQRSDRSE